MGQRTTQRRFFYLRARTGLRLALYGAMLLEVVMIVAISTGVVPVAHSTASMIIAGIVIAFQIGAIELAMRWLARSERTLEAQTAELQRLASVAQRTTNAVVITDAQRRITWVNEGFTRVSGYTLEEVIGRVPGDFLQSTNTDEQTTRAIGQALSKGQGYVGEILNVGKHGREYWLLIDIQPMRDDQSQIVGYMAVESEITQQKRDRANQARLAAELAGFFESSPDLLCILDGDGVVTRANAAWTMVLGIGRDDVVGRPLTELIHGDDASHVLEQIRSVVGGSIGRFRTRCQVSDGTWCTLEWRASSYGDVVFAAARDVSEAVEIEQRLVEQADRIDLALAGGNVGMWDWEVPTSKLAIDERWAAMVGETPESLGDGLAAWSDRCHPQDLDYTLERLRQHFEEGRPYKDVQFRLRHRNGNWRWIRSSGRVVSWEPDGSPNRMVGVHLDVTDAIEQEKERDETKKRVELALRAGQMGLWDWDLDTGEFRCDQRWASTLGEWVDDIVPDVSSMLSRIHEDDLEDFEQAIRRHSEGGTSHFAVQCRMRCRDGTWRWVRLFGAASSSMDDKRGQHLVGIQMDVHDQVLAERELARREALLASSVRMTGVGGWEYDLTTQKLFWSEQVRAIHEVPDDYEPNVADGIEFYYGDDKEKVAHYVQRAVEHGEPFDFECRFVTAKGRLRWVRSVGEPVFSQGSVVRLVGAFQDITEQREQRERVEESNRTLETAQSIARMGNWSYDLETGDVRWSKQLFEIYERSTDEGSPDYETHLQSYVPADAERLAAAVRVATARGTPYAMTLERANPTNGIRYVAIEGVPRKDDEGVVVGLFGTARDVTAEMEREAELREARLKAEVASRSKSEFLANMSHEIRTPMTSILGYADLLQDPDLAESNRDDYVATIKRNGEHLLAIINDILDISKIEAGQMGTERIEMNPSELLSGVIELVRVQAEAKGIGLEATCSTSVPARITSDPTRLRQILLNLIGNAIKFTESGTVRVSMGFEPNEIGGGKLRFDVVDTGIGMNSEQADRIFQAFTQADASMTRRFGGTGLGLRISKRLAELLGGDISVKSEPGKGSTFTVLIDAGMIDTETMHTPGSLVAYGASAGASESATPRPLEGCRVLLMEDGPDNLRLITTHLKSAGAQVTAAKDGAEGLKLLAEDGQLSGPLVDPMPFDIIISDLQMPNIDGYTAVRMLRAKGCTLPIIALTANSMSDERERCEAAGCDDFAVKPIVRSALVQTLRQHLDRSKVA